jgi:iron complex transport system ATP-binding protein
MTGPLLEVHDIGAGYRNHPVLKQIELLVNEHQFIGIIGPNGSGKSTLMQVLARSLRPESGVILLRGESPDSIPYREFGKKVGLVAQESEIPFAYTVYDIVMMGRNPHIPRFRQPSEQDYAVVRSALCQTGTLEFSSRSITSLSGGERQRVLIARVLAQDPDLLLLDEPFAHIDLHHQHELIHLIRDTTKGKKAVIGVFHDINLAASYCDHLVLLHEGVIRASGSPREILNESLLRDIFKISPVIGENPVTGTPHLYVSGRKGEHRGDGRDIYVISGGGTGTPLISLLVSEGHQVRCGVLSENDADCQTARRYGLEVITEPPFSRITIEHEMLVHEQIVTADRVIVTAMPVGWGNYPNIRVLERIPAHKVILILPDREPLIPDYTAGAATNLLNRLIINGAVRVCGIADVPNLLKINP